MTGGHTVAGVVNWDYLALKVGIFKHQSLNHFVYPAKKSPKRKLLLKRELFLRLMERPTSKFGVTLLGSQEALMPGVVGKTI